MIWKEFDVSKSQTEICQKFVDIIPDTFSEVITFLVVGDKLDDYDQPGLYGLFSRADY